jgi:outer membrane receptor protein involved in Fe transport
MLDTALLYLATLAAPPAVDTVKSLELDEVVVTGKSKIKEINESAYNVVTIDARLLRNTTLNLARALDRLPGVKIRETGGMGSGTRITLNGFSGRHVKIFMDGIPLEGSGSSFRLDNMPVNMADRVEIYKGVVPVELGADALGGAINIVTRHSAGTYIDLSLAYGSFNTLVASASVGHASRGGFTFQLGAYRNSSDNSYKVKTNLLDLATSVYSTREYRFKRFHDHYRDEALVLKAGLAGKSWADRLLVSLTLGRERADIQNANLMKIVYGGRERAARSVNPSLHYVKRNLLVPGLTLSLAAAYSKARNNNTDTLPRQYNWRGEYRVKGTRGESGRYTLGEFNSQSATATANLAYRPGDKHHLAANNLYSRYARQATDAAANAENSTAATFMQRASAKNILGLSYKFAPGDRWNLSAFFKHYRVKARGPVDASTTTTAAYEEGQKTFSTTGHGLLLTCFPSPSLQLKASYEKAYRLPSEQELFGDEILETGDMTLRPESSHNLNLNLSYHRAWPGAHALHVDLGLVYRDTRDYIRRQIEQRYGGAFYANHGRVLNLGLDLEARYLYKTRLSIGASITYQDLRNRERRDINGRPLVYYKDRVPNVPYLFGNLDVAYTLPLGKRNTLSLGYNPRYVHSFYRDWRSEGADIIIPAQLSSDLAATLSLRDGRYNLALEARNIADATLYDNYSLQKPGRSFTIKARYFFIK